MAAVEAVPKNGRNEHHGYNYATEGDVMAAVKTALIERKLLLLCAATPVSRTGNLTTVAQGFTWVDVETGDGLALPWVAEGSDPGDKGAYKAATGGLKFFLLKNLQIPTGDDPEAGEQTPAAATISADEMADRAVASGAAREEAPDRRAGQAGGGARTATDRQKGMIRGRAKDAGISNADLKQVVQEVAGNEIETLDQLPQRFVDAVLERLAK
jgi:hypothetical protein